MNQLIVLQWLPGIAAVAVVAFPAFFFIHRGFVVRLAVALASVVAFLFLFGVVLGHEFHFLRAEDMPPLFLGLALSWFLSAVGRALKETIARRQAK